MQHAAAQRMPPSESELLPEALMAAQHQDSIIININLLSPYFTIKTLVSLP